MTDLSFVQIVTILAPDFRRGGIYQEESDLSSLHLHSDKQLTNFSVRSDELTQTLSSNLRRALEKRQTFAAQPTGWLVYQSTSYGNGKTHLAAAIANEITRAANRRCLSSCRIYWAIYGQHSALPVERLDKRFDEVRNSSC